jgi:hypothetical protein
MPTPSQLVPTPTQGHSGVKKKHKVGISPSKTKGSPKFGSHDKDNPVDPRHLHKPSLPQVETHSIDSSNELNSNGQNRESVPVSANTPKSNFQNGKVISLGINQGNEGDKKKKPFIPILGIEEPIHSVWLLLLLAAGIGFFIWHRKDR